MKAVKDKFCNRDKIRKFQNIINKKEPCLYCGSKEHFSSDGFYCTSSYRFCVCDCKNNIELDEDEYLEWCGDDEKHPVKMSYKYDYCICRYHDVFEEHSRIEFKPYRQLVITSRDGMPNCMIDYSIVMEDMKEYFMTWEGLVRTHHELIDRFDSYKKNFKVCMYILESIIEENEV
jgi:hypothetical protein